VLERQRYIASSKQPRNRQSAKAGLSVKMIFSFSLFSFFFFFFSNEFCDQQEYVVEQRMRINGHVSLLF